MEKVNSHHRIALLCLCLTEGNKGSKDGVLPVEISAAK